MRQSVLGTTNYTIAVGGFSGVSVLATVNTLTLHGLKATGSISR